MSKSSIVVSCPIDTYSGYGARARDFVKALIDIDKYDVKILAQKWGNTRWGYLKDHNDSVFTPRIIQNMDKQPDIWVQISIPNEFQKVGKYNIGVTAGMETTLCHPSWIKGANRMDLILASSTHTVAAFNNSKFDITNNKTKQIAEKVEIKTKVEVLFEGADLTKYFPAKYDEDLNSELTDLNNTLNSIPESFCFLTTGHWMEGMIGEDRKNVALTIKSFFLTFRNKKNPPALIMKTHTSTTSLLDRERVLDKIDTIRQSVSGTLPNIYLLHGEITDQGMNLLFNHSKVKALFSIPKGEGFGRPFLEFSLANKPIIASGWSGQTDFLNKDYVRYVTGELKNVHKTAAVKDIILQEAQWFSPDISDINKSLKDVYKNYKKWLVKAKRQGRHSRVNFNYEAMVETLKTILDTNIPEFPKQLDISLPSLTLPKLKKVNEVPKITLPKLNK